MNMIQRYWPRKMILRKTCKHIWILPLLVKQPMFLYRHLIAEHPRCPFWFHRTSQGLEEVSKNVTLCKWLILSRKNSGISGFPADRWWEFDLTWPQDLNEMIPVFWVETCKCRFQCWFVACDSEIKWCFLFKKAHIIVMPLSRHQQSSNVLASHMLGCLNCSFRPFCTYQFVNIYGVRMGGKRRTDCAGKSRTCQVANAMAR